ncbi:MAG: hypothetical protein BJ554DRAFT_232, partial [Olpidium bornovanus]
LARSFAPPRPAARGHLPTTSAFWRRRQTGWRIRLALVSLAASRRGITHRPKFRRRGPSLLGRRSRSSRTKPADKRSSLHYG